MSAPDSGTVLANKYRVTRQLGEGGMGVVIEAMHVQLEQRVAIKFLRPEALAHASLVTRFSREARAMTRIKSEHVARVLDVGNLDSGAPYMVMEYLEGKDLEAVVAERGQLAVDSAVEMILQASEALAEAHTLGIIHRDLKPANLFLTQRADGSDCVKVLDFGISKTRSSDSSEHDLKLTQTAGLLGSPMYMAPEQMFSAKEVDPRTDIWALGVILFELLTGSPPFPGDTIEELRARMVQGKHLNIGSFRDDIPEELQAVVMRCLRVDPAHRFVDLAEFATSLAPFAQPHALVSVDRVRRLLSPKGLEAPLSVAGPYARTAVATGSATPQGITPRSPIPVSERSTPPVSAEPHITLGPEPSKPRAASWLVAAAGVIALASLISVALMWRAGNRSAGLEPAPTTPTGPTVAATGPGLSESLPPTPVATASTAAPGDSAESALPEAAPTSSTGKTQAPPRTLGSKEKQGKNASVPPSPEPTASALPPPTANPDLFNTRK